jgi:hypothetical protein
MPKLQNQWGLAAPLERALRDSPLSHTELAKQSGVSYYAVRRMRIHGVRNRGDNALALCSFFGISDDASNAPVQGKDLQSAVTQAWDGTTAHARLIIDLVRVAGHFRVAP